MTKIPDTQPAVTEASSSHPLESTGWSSGRTPGRAALKANALKGKPKQRISKTIVNFVLDAMLLALAVMLLFIAAVLRFVFPAPTMSAGWKLWGYGYDAWSNLEFALVAVFGLAILLHIMLHWAWVCGVLLSKVLPRSSARQTLDEGQQTLLGVGLLIVVVNLLGALVGLAYLTIQNPAN